MLDIPKLIKSKRLSLKETQKEFGKRFNISHAAVSDLERGVTKSIPFDLLNFVHDCGGDDLTFVLPSKGSYLAKIRFLKITEEKPALE